MTAREFLATRQGAALTAARVPGALGFWDGVGNLSSILSIIGFVQGLKPGSPGVGVEDLLKYQNEILAAIREAQKAITGGIGGISDQVGGISDQVGRIEDLLTEYHQSTGEQQQLIRFQLEAMMDQQQRQTQAILRAVGQVSQQVHGMWSNMNAWFTETLTQLRALSDMLVAISRQLAVIMALLQEVLEGISELSDRVEWNAIISMLAEHEHRIRFAIETAMDIQVTLIEDPDDKDSEEPDIRVDPEEVRAWATAIADLEGGLAYSLYTMHQVLIGDTLLDKPMLEVYLRLLSHNNLTDVQRRTASRFYAKFVAAQAQGFSVLDRARQYLGLPALDVDATLGSRVDDQVAVAKRVLRSVLNLTEWGDDNLSPLGGSIRKGEIPSTEQGARYYTVRQSGYVISGFLSGHYESGVNHEVSFGIGRPIPETRTVTDTYRDQSFRDGNHYHVGQLLMRGDASVVRWDPRSVLVRPEFAVVGFKFSTPGGVLRIEPLAALYDPVTGTVSWDGRTGQLWIVQAPDPEPDWEPAQHTFVGENGRTTDRRDIDDAPGMVRGLRFSMREYSPTTTLFDFSFASTNWEPNTWLPGAPSTPGATYTAITLEGQPAADNLALNKPATADSSVPGLEPENAVDGNPGTYWRSASEDGWLTVDLGEDRRVGYVILRINPAWGLREQTLSISGSSDNQTFTTLSESATYAFDPAIGNAVLIAFEPAQERYIRVSITGNTGGNQGQIHELQVYAPTGAQTDENLSRERPATASTGSYPGRAVDGAMDTYWSSKFESNDPPVWFQVDLGEVCAISHINLFSNRSPRTERLSVTGSTDGSSYTPISQEADYPVGPSGVAMPPIPTGTHARYVKIDWPGPRSSVEYREICVYGTRPNEAEREEQPEQFG